MKKTNFYITKATISGALTIVALVPFFSYAMDEQAKQLREIRLAKSKQYQQQSTDLNNLISAYTTTVNEIEQEKKALSTAQDIKCAKISISKAVDKLELFYNKFVINYDSNLLFKNKPVLEKDGSREEVINTFKTLLFSFIDSWFDLSPSFKFVDFYYSIVEKTFAPSITKLLKKNDNTKKLQKIIETRLELFKAYAKMQKLLADMHTNKTSTSPLSEQKLRKQQREKFDKSLSDLGTIDVDLCGKACSDEGNNANIEKARAIFHQIIEALSGLSTTIEYYKELPKEMQDNYKHICNYLKEPLIEIDLKMDTEKDEELAKSLAPQINTSRDLQLAQELNQQENGNNNNQINVPNNHHDQDEELQQALLQSMQNNQVNNNNNDNEEFLLALQMSMQDNQNQ